MSDLAPVIVVLGVVGTVAWTVRLFLAYFQKMKIARMHADLNARLLDKFGSAPEVVDYLQSEAGERLLQATTAEVAAPQARILGSIRTGVIMVLLGAALLLLRGQMGREAVEAMLFLGAVSLALGLGFLLSSGISYRLSKSWGLINGSPREIAEP